MQEERRKKRTKSMISFTVLEKDENAAKLLVKGLDETYVNTLRRLMQSQVPVMAIEDVEIRKNSSILYDEIIAHRLGLIPFRTDLKSYEEVKEGEPLNAKNSLHMTLTAKGPGYVYASQIKTKDPKIVPVFPKLPITKLLEGQELELEAVAILGKGKTHAKWSPGLFHYHQTTSVAIKKQPDNAEEVAKKFPKGVFEVKANKLVVADENKTLELEDFENAYPDIEITTTEDYIFYMETWGQLTPKEVFTQSLVVFDELLEEFQETMKTLK
jgi:DNA-directed RNA polymerase subunit D